MLSELHVVNWKPFDDATVNFTEGINLISGRNGSGKSSLLEALCFALYGEAALPYELEAAIRHGQSYARVGLKFRGGDGNYYRVERFLRLKPDGKGGFRGYTDPVKTRFIHPDGTVLVGTRKVDEEVAEHFGIPSKLFLEALNIRQGQLRYIVEVKGHEREKYLDRLIGISSLEECYERAWEIESWCRTNVVEREARVQTLTEQVQLIPQLMQEVVLSKEKLLGLEAQLGTKKTLFDELKAKVNQLQELKAQLSRIQSDMRLVNASLQNAFRTMEDVVKELKSLEEATLERVDLENRLRDVAELRQRKSGFETRRSLLISSFIPPNRVQEHIEELTAQLNLKLRNVEQLQRKTVELEAFLSEQAVLETRYSRYGEVSRTYEELSEKWVGLRTEVEGLEKTLEGLKTNVDMNCPTCLQPITADYARTVCARLSEKAASLRQVLVATEVMRNSRREERERLEKEGARLKELAGTVGSLKTLIEALKKDIGEVEELEKRKTALEEDLRKALADEEEIREVEEALKPLNTELAEREKLRWRLEAINKRLEEKPGLETQLQTVKAEVAQFRLEAQRLTDEEESLRKRFSQDELDKQVKQSEVLNREVFTLSGEAGRIEGELRKMDEHLIELEERRTTLLKVQGELVKWRNISEITSKIRVAFRGSQSILRKQFIDSLNTEAGQVFLDVRRKSRLEGITVESDYGIYISEAGGRYPVGTYSGGEKTLTAIVLRTALAKTMLGEVPILIYDEPTEYLDREHRESLVSWIKDYGEIQQVIVVSNLEDFEDVADNIVQVAMGGEGVSTID